MTFISSIAESELGLGDVANESEAKRLRTGANAICISLGFLAPLPLLERAMGMKLVQETREEEEEEGGSGTRVGEGGIRQFWKAMDYDNVTVVIGLLLRLKWIVLEFIRGFYFLHFNATSHKWVLGEHGSNLFF